MTTVVRVGNRYVRNVGMYHIHSHRRDIVSQSAAAVTSRTASNIMCTDRHNGTCKVGCCQLTADNVGRYSKCLWQVLCRVMCGGTGRGRGELFYPLNMKREDTSPPNAPRGLKMAPRLRPLAFQKKDVYEAFVE